MKKIILIVIACSVGAWIAWLSVAQRVRVDAAARTLDPYAMELNRIEPMHKSRGRITDGIEVGLIHLKDGSSVKYWFVSRHVQPGKGITRFDFPDGETVYLRGVFCCEVGVGDGAAADKASMLKYIAAVDCMDP